MNYQKETGHGYRDIHPNHHRYILLEYIQKDHTHLDNHLKQVIAEIENRTELELIAIGIGHDVTKYYKKAVTIHRAEELGNVMLEQLTDLFQEK